MLGGVKFGEVLRLLREDSGYIVGTKGSHLQFKNPIKLGRVTVAGKSSDDIAP
jgi:predicted RNA binding protein YcfA (HicA-like mRNA interferase family)